MTRPRLTLCAGALELDLLPAVGGSVVRFERRADDKRQVLLRGCPDPPSSVLDTSCFPLVPFANRIRNGSFSCDGRAINLLPNMAGDPSPLHGQGWLEAWQVAAASTHEAELTFDHASGEWPWRYHARQRFALDPDGLSLTLTCRNESPEPMPCGLGFHPYYPCDADTVLDTGVASAWTVDAAVLPVANVPASGRYDLRRRRICGQRLDNGFEGWNGAALISWPAQPAMLRLSSPDAGRFQVYSPEAGGLFVAEPVQNANCALNEPQERWPTLGIAMLAQGEEAVLNARFDVVAT